MRERRPIIVFLALGCVILAMLICVAVAIIGGGFPRIIIGGPFVVSNVAPAIQATIQSVYATNTAIMKLIEGTQTAATATAQASH